MCHTFKHLFICNIFCCRLILLSLSLYIELALVCCTNPNNVNRFGTIFPNLNFVFASIWAARPVHIESDQYRSCSTVKQGPAVGATPSTPIGEQTKTALWLWVREMTWYLYTSGVRGRMKAKQRWFKVTRELCHEWFLHFRHHVHDGHWTGEFGTVIWRLHCFTVSFRGDVRGESIDQKVINGHKNPGGSHNNHDENHDEIEFYLGNSERSTWRHSALEQRTPKKAKFPFL